MHRPLFPPPQNRWPVQNSVQWFDITNVMHRYTDVKRIAKQVCKIFALSLPLCVGPEFSLKQITLRTRSTGVIVHYAVHQDPLPNSSCHE